MACLFKETRVGLDWVRPNVTFQVNVPAHIDHSAQNHQHHRAITDGIERKHHEERDQVDFADDETRFAHENLASSASVHFRAIHRYPRSILWRVVEGGRVLILVPVDISKSQGNTRSDYGTAYRLHFPSPVQPSCIAFYDPAERDAVIVFALTTDNVLYTLNLRQDFFTTADEDVRLQPGWCNTYLPSTLSIRPPHFVRAVSTEVLLIGLQDGGLLRLTRVVKSPDPKVFHGYQEQAFSDGTYLDSIKSLVRWNNTQIRYGEVNVSPATIISIAHTYRYSLLFTVSINHQLKVWSMERGVVLSVHDLLDDKRVHASSSIRNFLDPIPATLVKLIDLALDPRHMFYLLTFSPASAGIFKIWAGTDDNTSSFSRLVDLYPNDTFQVQPPSLNTLWVVTDFSISPISKEEPSKFSLWVLWKSNTSSKLQNVYFDIGRMPDTFPAWTSAGSETLSAEKPRSPSSSSIEDIVMYWSDWIFAAGRFSDATMETALNIFSKNFANSYHNDPKAALSLQDRVHAAIELALQQKMSIVEEDDILEVDIYKRDKESQWSQFWRLCSELDKQRREALSLAIDESSGLPYVVNADALTFIRESTDAEILCENLDQSSLMALQQLEPRLSEHMQDILRGDKAQDVYKLLRSAVALKQSMPELVFDDCVAALQEEILTTSSETIPVRINTLYDRCFHNQIPLALSEDLRTVFKTIKHIDQAFNAIATSLTGWSRREGQSKLTTLGEMLLLKGSQEVIHVNYTLLFDVTQLLIFIYSSEDINIPNVDALDTLYVNILQLLKEHEVLAWLSKNSWQTSKMDEKGEAHIRQSLAHLRNADAKSMPEVHNTSILQILLDEQSGPPPSSMGTGAKDLLSCIRRFLSGVEIDNYDNTVIHITARLLKMEVFNLAHDFSTYLPATPWGGYMRGRVALANEYQSDAVTFFKEAAVGISSPRHTPISSLETMFSLIEVSMLGAGMPKYYYHIAQLFEKHKYYAEVVTFTLLALDSMPMELQEDGISLRSDILSRQFNAAVLVEMYDEAYNALTQFSNKALQKQALRTLVSSMCENHAAEHLCRLPFTGLFEEVDAALEYKCHNVDDLKSSPPFHKMLYAWRIQHMNFRGAAAILYDYLQRLLASKTPANRFSNTEISDTYLILLNVLSCVTPEQAWVFTKLKPRDENGKSRDMVSFEGTKALRRVVTLENIREEYQAEMERMQVYLSGGYFF